MVILGTIGSFVRKQKDHLRAREYYKESLQIGIELKNKRTVAETLLEYAELLCGEERYSESARLHGFAQNLFGESESLTEVHLAQINRIADVPKKCLGEDSYQKEFDLGKRLKLDQAVEIAMR